MSEMGAAMSIDMTIRLVLIGTLAAMTFIGLAMGEDTYSARRRTSREASQPLNASRRPESGITE